MGSLSADKAGVGSAVNDTTRELGGTLGVAIVGSVFASVYSGRLGSDSAVAALPARGARHDGTVDGRRPAGHRPSCRQAGRPRRPRGRQHRVPRRTSGRLPGLRGHRRRRPRSSSPGCCRATGARQAARPISAEARGGVGMSYTDSWTDGHGTVQYFTRSDGSRLRYFTAGSRTRAGTDAHHPHAAGLLPPRHPAAVGLVHRLRAGPARHGLVGHRARRPLRRAATCGPRWSSSSPDSTSTTSPWPGNRSAARSRSGRRRPQGSRRRVVAFNTYDYPSGLERGNLFARFIIRASACRALGRSSPRWRTGRS